VSVRWADLDASRPRARWTRTTPKRGRPAPDAGFPLTAEPRRAVTHHLADLAEHAADLAAAMPVTGSMRLYQETAGRRHRHRAAPAIDWRRQLGMGFNLVLFTLASAWAIWTAVHP
jgi:hypothetical protein